MNSEIEGLLADLKSDSPFFRAKAVKQLSKLDDSRVVGWLIPMLQDINKDVRVATVVALGEIENELAIEPLISLWRREVEKAQTFSDSEDAEAKTVHPGLISRIIIRHFSTHAVNALIANIDLFGVIYVLGEIGDERAVNPLLAILNEPEITFRHTAAIIALGKIGDPKAISTLERFVEINQLSINMDAREAIQKIRARL